MPNVLATLPVHLALQLIVTGNHSLDNGIPHTPLPQPNTVLPDGYTAFPDIGVAMKYFSNNLSWNSARKHCIMEGGNLVVIDSLVKSRYANALRKTNPLGAFLGIHKLFDNVEWVSVKTGLPIEFIPWKVGTDRTAPGLSCTVLWGNDEGRVGPADCNGSTAHTCEIPLSQDYNVGVQSSPIQGTKLNDNEKLKRNDSVDLVPN